ncbi:type II secretion system protein [Lentisphaera profundi]|uniref:Type II secretion system protein n=1 Tax=Lentisphaera profundi TaxID=1658616 RepID=A0ABY7VUG9_9BACT|nr:type II secretion system protein [Lentisphaera profundi]WDE96923.1 type II secretion system protein [Lentisphaera profundi]
MNKKFTLIELLVVVAIIGTLASLLLPVLGQARKTALATSCLNSNKQVAFAMIMFREDNDGAIAYGYSSLRKFQSGVDTYLGGNALPGEDASVFYNNASPTWYACPSTALDAENRIEATDYGMAHINNYQSLIGRKVTQINDSANAMLLMDTLKTDDPSIKVGRYEISVYSEDKYNKGSGLFYNNFKHNKQRASYTFVDGHGELIKWIPRYVFNDKYTKEIFAMDRISVNEQLHPDFRL